MSTSKKSGYTSQQVCNKLDVCKKTLYNWEKVGLIPKIERDWRKWRIYSERDLEQIKKTINIKSENGDISPNKKGG